MAKHNTTTVMVLRRDRPQINNSAKPNLKLYLQIWQINGQY